MPSAWQQRVEPKQGEPQFDFDLAIVGGGVGGAYLVSRLHEEFVLKRGLPMPKVALFERSDKVGGRLMSGYGAGALNLGVGPMSKATEERGPLPMPEYGGMRVDPHLYPHVVNRIAYYGRLRFGPGTCPIPGCDFFDTSETRNCCPDMLKKMEVGDIRYVTKDPDASTFLQSSTVNTTSKLQKPLLISDIAGLRGEGSPFDQCLLLVVAADAYYSVTGKYGDPKVKVTKAPADGLWKTSIDELCSPVNCTASGIAGMCELCHRFGDTAARAAISCSGYDLALPTVSLLSVVGLTEEVTDVTKSTNLYLLSVGLQRFTMGLLQGPEWTENASDLGQLFENRGTIVAPQYGKQLQSLSATKGTDTKLNTKDLVDQQIKRLLHGSNGPYVNATGVTLNFADGSSATAKSAYLSMLPYDLAALDDFGGWEKEYDNYLPDKLGAVKLSFGWSNASEALGARLNLTSCNEGKCERLILDGPADSWVMRQVWLWDANTILIYETAPYEDLTAAVRFPSNRLVKMSREEGMDAMVKECFKQIRNTTGLSDLKDPDWARLKVWPFSTLLPGWNATATDTDTNNFVEKISRPLGDGVPLYYGNSEVAKNGDNHGWVEGALEQVELALTDLTAELGLKNYTKYDPKNLSMLDEFAPPPPPPPPPSVGITTLVAAIVASYVAGAISDSAATIVVASFVGGAVSVLAFQRFLGRGPLSSRRAKTQ